MYGIVNVAAITVICFLIGESVKVLPLDNKFIPVICGVAGAVLGALAFYLGMPDFPASDIITAIAVGIVSGFAATGVNESIKQIKEKAAEKKEKTTKK